MGLENDLKKLDRNSTKPLYIQLREMLYDVITSGKYQENEKILSENELSKICNLSRMTVRSVITDLVKEGVLYRIRGKGTYVAKKFVTVCPSYIGMREQLEQMGYEVKTKIIEYTIEKCNDVTAKYLQIDKESSVLKIKRLRYVDDMPISIHISYINSEYSGQITTEALEREQLCILLNTYYNLKRKRIVETLESVLATEEESILLNISKGYPLLLLKDIIYSDNGEPYEYSKVVFRGDKIKIKLKYD
ncbi:MAG: GntR family transcriptional regulator [Lachnospiraceae bacterium]|nr:GntR family transcriptional regulator [Lachnospiraceae bacterium]